MAKTGDLTRLFGGSNSASERSTAAGTAQASRKYVSKFCESNRARDLGGQQDAPIEMSTTEMQTQRCVLRCETSGALPTALLLCLNFHLLCVVAVFLFAYSGASQRLSKTEG